MVPVGRGVQQEYQDMQHSFTCCVGTGMESHALHGYGIYYESADTLWVNLFAPSTAKFTTAGVNLKMETGFPDGDDAKLTLTFPSPKEFTLAIRRPGWAGDGFKVKVNGADVAQPTLASLAAGGAGGSFIAADQPAMPSSVFVELKRTWKSGDVVELTLPKTVRIEPTPDNKTVAAVMWGPLVLAGDHGPRVEGRASSATTPVPALVSDKPVAEWVVPDSQPGNFRANQVARVLGTTASAGDVPLTPFYRTHRRRYSVYFDVLTNAEFDARNASIAAEKERVRKMEAATLGFVQPGDMQAERTYNFQSDQTGPPQRTNGRSSRGGAGWLSYDLPVDPATDVALIVTHFNEPGLQPAQGNFQILVDGTEIARFQPNATAVGFFDVQYAIPLALVHGKSKVTIRFQAVQPGRIAPVFGVRTIRSN